MWWGDSPTSKNVACKWVLMLVLTVPTCEAYVSGSHGPCCHHGDESNGPRTAHQDAGTERHSSAACGVHAHAKGLQERALLQAHVVR